MSLRNKVRTWMMKKTVRWMQNEVQEVEGVPSDYEGEAVDTVWFMVGGIIVIALAYFLWPTLQSYGSQFLTLLWDKITGLLS